MCKSRYAYLDVENDEYIIVCNFVDRSMSGFKVLERGWGAPERGKPNKPRLN